MKKSLGASGDRTDRSYASYKSYRLTLPVIFGGNGYEKCSLAAFVDRNRASDTSLRSRANTRIRYTSAGTDLQFTNSGLSDNRLANHRKRGQGRSGRT